MSKILPWFLPIVAMILIAPFTPWLDLAVARYFYHPSSGFETNVFYSALYDWGTKPALIISWIAFFLFCLSWYVPEWKKWRRSCLFLALTMAIGSGLIVNLILKDHWGRPRPKQVIEFGGTQPYIPFYTPNFSLRSSEALKGFPCGHCAMGFYFFALALVGKRLNRPALFRWGIGLAVGLGVLLSLARIAQGGHFISDTLMSALVMWLTAYTLHLWIPEYERA
jgi:membrane-associated PAP2 superfamily phosphatase